MGPRGPPGQKGTKGEPGQSITAPSLLHSPVETTVNQSQTAIFKCLADGNPTPQITWSKMNSWLPVGRHKVESSGALILKDVRPGDEGVYSCEAKNLLGSVNASAKLTVQCKLIWSYLCVYIYIREFKLLANITGVLVIKFLNLWFSDEGLYSCEAKTLLGNVTHCTVLLGLVMFI